MGNRNYTVGLEYVASGSGSTDTVMLVFWAGKRTYDSTWTSGRKNAFPGEWVKVDRIVHNDVECQRLTYCETLKKVCEARAWLHRAVQHAINARMCEVTREQLNSVDDEINRRINSKITMNDSVIINVTPRIL